MTDERAELARRWDQVNRALDDLAAGRVEPEANPDPTAREAELLRELDQIEYRLGELGEERF